MWTKRLLEEYAEIFRKQVYSKDMDPKVVQAAIHITHTQSRKVGVKHNTQSLY
jgi:predicted RNA polymerase sigma factor